VLPVPLIFSTRAQLARQEQQDLGSELMRGEEKLERARKRSQDKSGRKYSKTKKRRKCYGWMKNKNT
jgi:hypothetical protein